MGCIGVITQLLTFYQHFLGQEILHQLGLAIFHPTYRGYKL